MKLISLRFIGSQSQISDHSLDNFLKKSTPANKTAFFVFVN